MRNLHFLLAAEDGFLEGQRDAHPQVVAPLGALAGPRIAEERLKNVAEAAHAVEGVEAAACVRTGVAEAVICAALFGVGQDLIGFVNLFEAVLSAWFPVAVGMVLERKPPERAPDVLFGR